MIKWIKSLMGLNNEHMCTERQHTTGSQHSGPGKYYVEDTCPGCGLVSHEIICQSWYDYQNRNNDVSCYNCKYSGRSRQWNLKILMTVGEGT